MNKLFRSALMALVIVTAAQAETKTDTEMENTISQIFGGGVTSKDVEILSEREMRETIGGYAELSFIAASGMVQSVGDIGATYQGQRLFMVAEKYGRTLRDGYAVYLTTDNPNRVARTWTSRGQVRVFNQVPINRETIRILNTNMPMALDKLTGRNPTYR